ncbi:cardiolipin synthase [Ruminococcaceae bacterium OttesenSCG-928-A16]|nr:cardiolipin synthase [Ruminococcaceae bacterium OttesenSCG-928-A16]
MLAKIKKLVLSKTFAFALLALLQIGFFVALVYFFANSGALAYTILTIITVLVLVIIFEQDELNPAYKVMWILIIVVMPITGALFYLLWGHRHVPRRKRKQLIEIEEQTDKMMQQDETLLPLLQQYDKDMYHSAQYLWRQAAAPLYAGAKVEYYPIGDDFFPRFLEAIRGAKKFIYMEYFIYREGVMWDTTLEILRQKAAEGVDVRVLYDGFGSLFTLPNDYYKTLRSYGIQCYPFAPLQFTLHLSDYAMLNHRDHRKITVVDGEIGFSGGLNFADEYINQLERFGEWKDTAFRIEGEAVYSLTITFLKAWDYAANTTSDYESYRPAKSPAPANYLQIAQNGLVQPYCDSPLDAENVSENAYLNVISRANHYVYISTPYLVLDYEMINSLSLAAKSGVDVRILTPGIPDKSMVFLLTQSYYPTLLRSGVRIYEYTPGFNHAKMYVSDDKQAIIGSANMDYRSLYLHFENCVSFYGGTIVHQAKQDMVDSFAKAHEITLDETKQTPFLRRIMQIIVRFFAPML